jgi:hypothetical protein
MVRGKWLLSNTYKVTDKFIAKNELWEKICLIPFGQKYVLNCICDLHHGDVQM